jgi:hypothetical protein
LRPVTLESRAEHTDRAEPSQDSGVTTYIVDLFMFIESTAPPAATVVAPQKPPERRGARRAAASSSLPLRLLSPRRPYDGRRPCDRHPGRVEPERLLGLCRRPLDATLTAHFDLALVFSGLIVLHVAAALYH